MSGNSANNAAGGIWPHGSHNVTISHSTITNNTSDADQSGSGTGGGIFVDGGLSITLNHTIVAGNIDNTGVAPDIDNSALAVFSLIGNNQGASITNSGGTSLIGTSGTPIDPKLEPLADNSGITQTHALVLDSPAVDAGDPAFNVNSLSPPLTSDQRGPAFNRVVDGDGNSSAIIDIGAYERREIGMFVVDIATDENDGNFNPGDLSLREAIQLANELPGLDIVHFSPALTGETITMAMGEFDLTDSITIHGLGAADLTIDAAGSSRLFNISDGLSTNLLDVEISDLTLTGGTTGGDGGAIFIDRENVTLDRVVLTDNQGRSGGAIWASVFNNSSVVVRDSTIVGNHATSQGGAIRAAGAAGDSLSIVGTTISGNTANHDGGGVFVFSISGFPVSIAHSTITDNVTDVDDNGSGFGGGLVVSLSPSVVVDHTIIAGNYNSTLDYAK